MAQEPCAFHLYKAPHFYPLTEKGQASKQNSTTKNFKADLLKIANAKLLTDKTYRALIDNAHYTGRSLQNKILNLPPVEEERMKSDLCRAIIDERQRDGHFNVDSISSGSDCPDDFEVRKKFIRDKIIYSPDALSGKNMIYVWEDPDSRIHVSDLAIIVMGLL